MDIRIKQLALDDTDAAAKVMRHSFEQRLPSLARLHTPEEDAAFVRSHLFRETEMWGAFDAQLVGFIAFDDEWIKQLYILPEWQGRGLGKALLEIAKANHPKLRLWTFQQNMPAREFYERNGFVPVEMTDGLGNEHRSPDILYQWVREELGR